MRPPPLYDKILSRKERDRLEAYLRYAYSKMSDYTNNKRNIVNYLHLSAQQYLAMIK
ncbi:hypothetical protein [Lactococcus lactis]|uniref:hypothetical protein n=1 Tax=Lactococcus lactis TaxID=1358 RepID=UPI0035D74744